MLLWWKGKQGKNTCTVLERFSYGLEMKTREKTETNERKQSDLIGLSNGYKLNARGFWLVKRTVRWKNFKLENFLEIYRYFALTSYCNTTGQSNKCFLHTRVFFGGKTKIPCFDLFIHWLIEQIMNTYQNHFSRSYENRSIISIYQANFSTWRELSADVSIAIKLKRCYIFFQFHSL